MKNIISLISVLFGSTVSIYTLNNNEFKYKYQVIANSKSTKDTVALYSYKEKLIEIYETRFINYNADDLSSELQNGISYFKIDDNCAPYYKKGVIVIIVGNGNGLSISGELRESSCDSTTIREKFFIFEIFG